MNKWLKMWEKVNEKWSNWITSNENIYDGCFVVSIWDIEDFGVHWYRRVTWRLLNRSLWCCKKSFCWHVRKMKLWSLGWRQVFPQPGSTIFSHNAITSLSYRTVGMCDREEAVTRRQRIKRRRQGWGGKGDLESNCSRIEKMKWEECNTGSERAVTQKTVTHTEHLKILCHSNRNN